ncbi:MAG: peptide/nickel transport system substrate-binding protein [Solirubrobacteraceae bacterium]
MARVGTAACQRWPSLTDSVLRVATSQLGTLDPARSPWAGGFLSRNVYGGLLAHGGDGRLVPWLATSVETSDDTTEWAFTLREGVRFHDGAELDATAVKRSFAHYAAVSSEWRGDVPHDAELDDSDPGVFRVSSRTPAPDVARGSTVMQVFSPRLLDLGPDAPARAPIGTGPFRVTGHRAGERLVLEAFEDFWGEGPYLDRLELRVYDDPRARVTALRDGAVDFVFKVGPEQLHHLGPSFRVVTSDLWAATNVVFLFGDGPTADRRVRQAIAHAIDRDALVGDIALDEAKPLWSWLPHGVYGSSAVSTVYRHDPAASRALLAATGLAPERLAIRIATNEAFSTRNRLLCQVVAQMLNDAGLRATVHDVTLAEFRRFLEGQPPWDIVIGDVGHIDGGPIQLNGDLPRYRRYSTPGTPQLVERVRATPDGPEREALLAEIQELMAQDIADLPLFQPRVSSAMASDLLGYANPPDGIMPYLGSVHRIAQPGEDAALPDPIRQACELLAADLKGERELREIAAAVGLSYEAFRKRFRAFTGTSPASFRLDRRVETAQELLRTTPYTHAEIADRLGFADAFSFTKCFRARVGVPPRDYRRSHRATGALAARQ